MIEELIGLAPLNACGALTDLDNGTVGAVLEQAASFYEDVLEPTNRPGDHEGAVWQSGKVRVPESLRLAYRRYAAGGLGALRFPAAWGGLGLPRLVAAATVEMLNSANLAFGSGMLLCDGAIEALLLAGSDTLRQLYLPKLISGGWTGAMNFTEPQAGSDLSQIRARARRAGDHYRVVGQKIYITFGEHDMAENIVHLVLARVDGAPAGVRGLSLFLIPKIIPDADGALGARNDVHALSIEHKLGIRASPTCVMAFGDTGGAAAWLIGEEGAGLDTMFIMMNAARFTVCLQGIGLAERAFQMARDYALERVQGRPIGHQTGSAIVEHPDVRRMLMTMAASIEAARALAAQIAAWLDLAEHHTGAAERARCLRFAEFLIPVHKGLHTEMATEVASIGLQVHGGIGFTEDCGAAQLYRDARILPIYEGTTAIQANDLLGRKTLRDGGATAHALLHEIRATLKAASHSGAPASSFIAESLYPAVAAIERVVTWLCQETDQARVYAASVPYLRAMGQLLGGWMMCRAAIVAEAALKRGPADAAFYQRKLAVAKFHAAWIAPQVVATEQCLRHDPDSWLQIAATML